MDNNELLSQVASLINAQTEVLDARFLQIDNRLDKLEEHIKEVEKQNRLLQRQIDDLQVRLAAEEEIGRAHV